MLKWMAGKELMTSIAKSVGVEGFKSCILFSAPDEVRAVESIRRWAISLTTALTYPLVPGSYVKGEVSIGGVDFNHGLIIAYPPTLDLGAGSGW